MKLKKILSIILALVLLLSLAACGAKDDADTDKPSDNKDATKAPMHYTALVEKNKVSKKFKTEDGSVYFKIDFCLPHFDTEDENVIEASTLIMNAAFEDILNESIEFAENNVKIFSSLTAENIEQISRLAEEL